MSKEDISKISDLANEVNLPEKEEVIEVEIHKHPIRKLVYYFSIFSIIIIFLGVLFYLTFGLERENIPSTQGEQQVREVVSLPINSSKPDIVYIKDNSILVQDITSGKVENITSFSQNEYILKQVKWLDSERIFMSKTSQKDGTTLINIYEVEDNQEVNLEIIKDDLVSDIFISPDEEYYVYVTQDSGDYNLVINRSGVEEEKKIKLSPQSELDIIFTPNSDNFVVNYTDSDGFQSNQLFNFKGDLLKENKGSKVVEYKSPKFLNNNVLYFIKSDQLQSTLSYISLNTLISNDKGELEADEFIFSTDQKYIFTQKIDGSFFSKYNLEDLEKVFIVEDFRIINIVDNKKLIVEKISDKTIGIYDQEAEIYREILLLNDIVDFDYK